MSETSTPAGFLHFPYVPKSRSIFVNCYEKIVYQWMNIQYVPCCDMDFILSTAQNCPLIKQCFPYRSPPENSEAQSQMCTTLLPVLMLVLMFTQFSLWYAFLLFLSSNTNDRTC